MSSPVVEAFTARLAVEADALFVVDRRGHRLWFDRRRALQFAFAVSLLHKRKHQVHGVLSEAGGRWLWHVRAVPAVSLFDGGAGDALAAFPPVAGASSAPASPSLSVGSCVHGQSLFCGECLLGYVPQEPCS